MTSFETPDPTKGPKVLADLLGANTDPQQRLSGLGASGNTQKPPASGDAAQQQNPAAETADPAKAQEKGAEHNAPPQKPGSEDDHKKAAEDAAQAENTYTTTEPGFPIGQLISGIVSGVVGAGTAGASLALGAPAMAMSAIMPIMQSLLAVLGNPAARPPGAALTAPSRGSVPEPTGYSGQAADNYREHAKDTERKETEFDAKDTETNGLIDEARKTNEHASSLVRKAISDLQTAAVFAPATGPQAFAAASRDALHAARTAVGDAVAQHQALAVRLANIDGPNTP